MAEETELPTLAMADGSTLVLSREHVYQRTNRGWLGETNMFMPRAAITMVKLEWRRRSGLLSAGIIALLLSAPLQFIELPFAVPFYLAPALAALGAALTLLSFVKSKIIQVNAAAASIGGTPRNYADAQRFCSLIVSGTDAAPRPAATNERSAARRDSVDSHWQL